MADLLTQIHAGKKIAPFNGKNVFSVKKHQNVLDHLNPLLNIRVVSGSYNHVEYSSEGVILFISGSGGSDSGGITLDPYRIKSFHGSYVTCRTWDGTSDGPDDIYIAVATKLRFTIGSEVLAGVTVTYSSYSTSNQTRSATDGTNTETQQITPLVITNDIIYAATPTNAEDVLGITVSGSPVTLLDFNIDGRAWAART